MGKERKSEKSREALEKFKGGRNMEIRRQEKIDIVEERDFRRGELPEKFTAKMLYGWDDKKVEEEYLKKVKSSFSGEETLRER